MRRRRRLTEVAETPVDALIRAVAARRRAAGMPWPPVRNDGHSKSEVTTDAPEAID